MVSFVNSSLFNDKKRYCNNYVFHCLCKVSLHEEEEWEDIAKYWNVANIALLEQNLCSFSKLLEKAYHRNRQKTYIFLSYLAKPVICWLQRQFYLSWAMNDIFKEFFGWAKNDLLKEYSKWARSDCRKKNTYLYFCSSSLLSWIWLTSQELNIVRIIRWIGINE